MKEVFRQIYVEELPVQWIAKRNDCSVQMIESYYNKVVDFLRYAMYGIAT
jgi:DNA-directed RNA polymerase specialized sigma24 family protein